jgi:hypothetical protein
VRGREVVAQIMYTHVSKCKTKKTKFENRLKKLRIKARAHKGGVRISKTPKKLANICCP